MLLDATGAEVQRQSAPDVASFGVDNLRQHGGADWRMTFALLSESVPVLVMDTRTPSPAVLDEIRRIIAGPLCEKTLFVIAEDGSAPALQTACPDVCLGDLQAARISEIVARLKLHHLKGTAPPMISAPSSACLSLVCRADLHRGKPQ
jgi:hypothetical protein